MKLVKKAVFPVGGLGTRFLPATKSMPKEMLPIANKPIIQYAFEEAKNAGIEQFIFITGRNKNAINNHFDHAYELESKLDKNQKSRELDQIASWLPDAGQIAFLRQQQPLGLGHAVWCARNLIGDDEPFAVILADEMIFSKENFLKSMIDLYYQKESASVVAITESVICLINSSLISTGLITTSAVTLAITGTKGDFISVSLKTFSISILASCIKAEWKAPLTGREIALLTPFSFAITN